MKKLFIFISLCISYQGWACNFGSVHPILWHYNQVDKVFMGRITKIGNPDTGELMYREKATNIPTFKIHFEVYESYRGTIVEKEIEIGKKALLKTSPLEVGDTYLVYAIEDKLEGLLVSTGILHILDPRMQRHDILKEINEKRNGHFVEYSITGEKWAEGEMANGIPYGEWKYYEITGELKEKGKFKKGKRHGRWETYFVTQARYYKLFDGIIKRRARRYKFVSNERITNSKSPYVYELKYQNLGKEGTPVESVQYLYKRPIVERKTCFKNGMVNGKEKLYNDHGVYLGYFRYKNNLKHGKYKYMDILPKDANGKQITMIFIGEYVENRKKNQKILHYENKKLIGVEETHKNFEM